MSKQAQIVMVFVLISILSVFGRLTPFKFATENTTQLLQINSMTNTQSLVLASSDTITSQEELPAPVKNAVLEVASQDVNLPTSKLKIIEAQPRTWKNGCLEVSNSNELCAQVLVNGWEVAVRADDNKTLVYHTNDSGSVVRLNPNQSEITQNQSSTTNNEQIKPVTIHVSELPPPLERNVIFQQISRGGFTGISDKTILLNDGVVIHVNIRNTNNSSHNVKRISRSQVQQFQDLLKQEKFSKFKNQSYPASTGSDDYKTYTLTSRQGTVQYNDISQSHLPDQLQVIIKAWNRISK